MKLKLLHEYMGFKAGTVVNVSQTIGTALLRDKAAEPVRDHTPGNKRAKPSVVKGAST